MRFTPGEARILAHRVGVAEAVAEALAEAYDADEVRAACGAMLRGYSEGSALEVDLSDPMLRAIVEDACDGSTYVVGLAEAVEFGEATRADYRAALRAAASLSRKVGVEVATS